MATLVSDVIDAVLRLVDEAPATPIFVSRAEVLQAIKWGLVELQIGAGIVQEDVTQGMGPGNYHQVPSSAMGVLDIRYGTKPLKLEVFEQLEREAGWQQEIHTPRNWSPLGYSFIAVWPRPVPPVYSLTMAIVKYVTVTLETDAIGIPEEYVDAIIQYGFSHVRFKEGGAQLRQAAESYAAFLAKAGIGSRISEMLQDSLWAQAPKGETGPIYERMTQA